MIFFVSFFPSLREKLGGSLATSLYSNYINFVNLSHLALYADMFDCRGPYWVWYRYL